MLPSTVSPFVFRDSRTLVPNELVNVEASLKNPDIFSVVNRIATDIASSPIEIEAPYDYLLNDNPNHLMNPFTFWTSVNASLLLAGNAYVTIHKDKQMIDELELINPADVIMTLTDNAKDIIYTVHYQDERPDKDFKSADMLHFKLLSAGDSYNHYTGRSPLDSLAESIAIQNYSNKLTLSTLKNGLAPTTLLELETGKPLNAESKQAIRESFEEQNTGGNAGRVVVVDQATKVSQLSINSDVANFLNNVTISKAVVAEAFGIPDSLLNGKSDQQSSVQMEQSVYQRSLNKYIKPIESELSYKLGVKAVLDIGSGLDSDNSSLINNLNKLTANQQVISTTQAQQALIEHGVLISGIDLPPVTQKGGETQTTNEN